MLATNLGNLPCISVFCFSCFLPWPQSSSTAVPGYPGLLFCASSFQPHWMLSRSRSVHTRSAFCLPRAFHQARGSLLFACFKCTVPRVLQEVFTHLSRYSGRRSPFFCCHQTQCFVQWSMMRPLRKILLAVVSSTRNVANLSLKKIKFGCCTTLSQLIPYYLTLLWSSSLSFFFFVSPLQYSLHPKDTAKCFTSSTEKEKLFLAPIAVVSIEHPAYPAHKAQSLILLGCTNASAIKQAKGQPAHLTCYQLATKVSLLSHWACSCINGHHLVIYISCERWWSHGVSFDSVVSECCPSYAYRSVIQKALH